MLASTTLRTSSKVALVASALMLSTAAAAPAFAAVGGNYGLWSEPSQTAAGQPFTGTITFTNTDVPDATYQTVYTAAPDGDITDPSNSVELKDSSEEWIGAETPFGAVFGANGASTDTNLLRIGISDSLITGTTTITFNAPAPAQSFGMAFGDIDLDSVDIEVFDADGNAISTNDLQGDAASDYGFNLCDETTNVPAVCADLDPVPSLAPNRGTMGTHISFMPDDNEDVGVTGWIAPSVEVSKVVVKNTTIGVGSSIRIWIAGIANEEPPAPPVLAETGTSSSMSIALAGLLACFGIAGLVIDRRRTARG